MNSELTITLITAIIGAVCSILGAILGVINTWYQISKNKLRLKVTPQHAIPVGVIANSGVNFSLEVLNLSDFPVTITDAGFLLKDGRSATLSTVMGFEQPASLPVKLEPRTTFTKYFDIINSGLPFASVKCAYAKTQCGETITGNSGALKQIVKRGRNE